MTLKSFNDGNSDEARQFLLDRRCERNHPKRHRTMKRKKVLAAKKRQRAQTHLAMRAAKIAKYKVAVRRYWAGLGDFPEDFTSRSPMPPSIWLIR